MPEMTRTLRTLQEDPEDFYVGSIADEIAQDMNSIGAIITKQDLADYKVRHREVLRYQFGRYTLHTFPAPFGGPIIIQILNILKGKQSSSI